MLRISGRAILSLALLPGAAIFAAQAQPASPPEAQAPAQPATLPVLQPVTYDRTARMRVPVSVNNQGPFPFLIDTGSEGTVIARELAERLLLRPETTVRIASMTESRSSPAYRLDRLQINRLEMRNLLAAGLEAADLGAQGLIGIDTLQDKKAVFDFRLGVMEVLPSRRARKAPPAERDMIVVEARRKAGRLILANAQVAGRRIDLVVDTGAQASVGNLALRDLLLRRGKSRLADVALTSVTGGTLAAQSDVVSRISIGGMEFTDIPIVYADGHAFRVLGLHHKPAMLLGMDTLMLFDRIEVDFANRRVIFQLPRGGAKGQRLVQGRREAPGRGPHQGWPGDWPAS